MEVEALLYRSDAPRIVYRQVRFSAGKTARTHVRIDAIWRAEIK